MGLEKQQVCAETEVRKELFQFRTGTWVLNKPCWHNKCIQKKTKLNVYLHHIPNKIFKNIQKF